MEVKLYVGNLAYETSEDDLRTLFAQAGAVTSVALIKDRDTGQSKGFAFVTIATQAEAQKAIEMFNAYSLADRELKVNLAKPREAPSGNQSRLGASAPTNRELNVKTIKPRSPGPMQGGYQSRFGAFSNNGSQSGPTSPGGGVAASVISLAVAQPRAAASEATATNRVSGPETRAEISPK